MIANRISATSYFMLLAACSSRLSVTTVGPDASDAATTMPPVKDDAHDSSSPTVEAGGDGACVLATTTARCPVVLRPCDCASSAGLLPIACGVNNGGFLNVVYPDQNGSVAAMSLCNDETC